MNLTGGKVNVIGIEPGGVVTKKYLAEVKRDDPIPPTASCARVTIYILRACYPSSAESSAATKWHTPISISPSSPSVGAKPSFSISTMPASLPNTSSPSPSASPPSTLLKNNF